MVAGLGVLFLTPSLIDTVWSAPSNKAQQGYPQSKRRYMGILKLTPFELGGSYFPNLTDLLLAFNILDWPQESNGQPGVQNKISKLINP